MGHILLSFLFYNILLIIFYNQYRKGNYYINKSHLIFYTILLIAFATYGSGEGDYLHHKIGVENIQDIFDVFFYDGMEIQYYYLAYFVGGNYTLWRLIIFSVQFIGMSWFMYKAKLNTYPVFLSFVTICLLLYTYQRSYWGVIFYFMGLYLLLEKRNPLYIIIIALCYVSHTQNIVLLVLLPLGFIKIKKWHLLIGILFIGLLATMLSDLFISFTESGGIEDADYLNTKAQIYKEAEKGYFGNSIGEYIIFILRYVPIVAVVVTWMKMLFTNKKKYLTFTSSYRGLINVTIGVFITSLVVLFASFSSGTFFYRILSMTLFPVSIILPHMVSNGILKKESFNVYIWIYIIGAELSCFKDMYYAYSSGAL